ncbi:MAG: 2-C-methyl-D-erythritol 4-phosphate cytidylyltransferase [Candidatus Solincola sediminis]|nr:MAG: 2-C-methyl-D-erythritol 4-phosphate cytidylyltransferase [Candidatus Solincola sediminis]
MGAGVAAIVAGAGRGERIGKREGKLFLELGGIPVIARSLLNLDAVPEIEEIVLAVNGEDLERADALIASIGLEKVARTVEGGEFRQESVFKALRSLSSNPEIIIVHDGARPLAPPSLFEKAVRALRESDCEGLITAVPVVDTIKEVEGGWVVKTPERRRLWAVQTPECFRAQALIDAHEKASQEGVWATDDAALLERYRYRVRVVEGEITNLKITFPIDLITAEALLKKGGLGVAVPRGTGL